MDGLQRQRPGRCSSPGLGTCAGHPDHPVTSGQQLIAQRQANALAVSNDGYGSHACLFGQGPPAPPRFRPPWRSFRSLLVTVHRAEPVRFCQQPCVLFPELLHGILLEHSEHDLTTGIRRRGSGKKESRPGIPERLSKVQGTWCLTACWSGQPRSSREHRPAGQQPQSCL